MAACERFGLPVMLYLDGELDTGERRLAELHLRTCAACRYAFRRERLFREGIRRRRPLHAAPDLLRTRIAAMLDTGPAVAAHAASAVPVPPARAANRLHRVAVLVLVAGIVAFLGIREVPDAVLPAVEAASFPIMAVDVHQRHQRGQLPLELETGAARDVSEWFAGKVPFVVTLPDHQDTSGQGNRFEIRGARLVGFGGGYAAYVAYEMDRHPISLVITSTSVAKPAGGQTVSSKGITFHFENIDGLEVVTWSHRSLTYALVSNLTEPGPKSCVVCHQGAEDRDIIDSPALLGAAPGNETSLRQSMH